MDKLVSAVYPELSLIRLPCWLSLGVLLLFGVDCGAVSLLSSGALRTVTSPATLRVGESLSITVMVENTGQPFLVQQPTTWFFGSTPSWIASIEQESWLTPPLVLDFYSYDRVFPGQQNGLTIGLNRTNLPAAPGTYSVLVNCFYPYLSETLVMTYLRMTDSPRVVTFTIAEGSPLIHQQPVAQRVPSGAHASFRVEASGTAVMGYQWYFNGAPIAGATLAVLSLPAATTNLSGSYTVGISNAYGQVLSEAALLVVDMPPVILSGPLSQTNQVGGTVNFSVLASSQTPPSFQWLFNGTGLLGATNSTLTLTNLVPADAGSYSVVVSNAGGQVTGGPVVLVVNVPAQILGQPSPVTVVEGATASFDVLTTGSPPLTYQWRHDGTDVLGATNQVLEFSNVTTNQAGSYQVVVGNSFGTATSSVATLTVLVRPRIVNPPPSRSVIAGDGTQF